MKTMIQKQDGNIPIVILSKGIQPKTRVQLSPGIPTIVESKAK
jgi:hypothetical protein